VISSIHEGYGMRLAAAVSALRDLRQLDLCDVTLGAEGFIELGRSVSAMRTLTSLSIQHTGLRNGGAVALAAGLSSIRSLLHFDGS
jgi:hypothetical protein